MSKDKSILEIVLMPLVIAIVGIVSSITIVIYEIKNSEKLGKAQLKAATEQAKSDREIKIIEIFAEKIVSKDEGERTLALRILEVIDSEIAKDLATVVVNNEPENSVIKHVAEIEVSKATQRIHNETFASKNLSLCEKYNSYSRKEWETNFLKENNFGTWHVFIASLPLGSSRKDAEHQVEVFERKYPNLAFMTMDTSNPNGGNSRYAIVLAGGINSELAKEIALFSDKCGIVKGAYAMRQSR